MSQLKDHPLLSPDAGLDTTAYAQLARQVLAGNWWLGPGLYYVSPFYIYFLAALLAIGKSFTVVRVVQIALGTASVGLIFLMARRWFGDRAAWIAGALAALTGLFTFYEVLILQSSVDVFFTSAALWCLTVGVVSAFRRNPSEGVASAFRRNELPVICTGLIWGIQTLNRPNVLIAVLGVALVMLIVQRRTKPAAMLLAGLLIGMSPVAIRNVVVAHEWTLVSSHGGLNFYIGNGAEATGFYHPVPGIRPAIVGQEVDTRRVAAKALGHDVTDAEASSYFFDLAWTWIRENPGDATLLFVKKLAFTVHAAHLALPQSYAFYAYDTPGILRYLCVGPWLLSPLGLLGVWVLARAGSSGSSGSAGSSGSTGSAGSRFSGSKGSRFSGSKGSRFSGSAALIWLSFVPAYAVAVALFFDADRYRLPLMVPLCVCAGGTLDFLFDAIRQSRPWRLLGPGIALAGLFVGVNWPVALDDARWTEGLRTAERLVIGQRYDEAERWAAWLESHNPPHAGSGQLGVAQQLMALRQYDRALPYLQRAEQANPAEPHIQYALGQTLVKLGRTPDAVPHLRRGFDGDIELPDAGEDYARALLDTGDLAGAAAAVRRIRLPESADAETCLRLGRLAMEAKAPDAAEPFFRQAAALQPQDAATRQQYGLDLLVLNRLEDAARELGEAARLDPRNVDTLSRLAYAEAKIGRTADARQHALAALAIDPKDPLATQLVAVLR